MSLLHHTAMDANGEENLSKSIVNVTTESEAYPKHWYVAQVRSCCERKTAQKMAALGIETFIPTQTEMRRWSDRMKKVERLLIPMMVFFKADETELKVAERISYVYCLLRAPGQRKPASIPDSQIERFKFMLGCESSITIEPIDIKKGDKVRVIRGHVAGLEGYITNVEENKSKVSIVIDFIGCASVIIDKSDLEIVDKAG